MEPIQSMGGVIEIDAGLLQQIERACRSKGALLIFDEVQTGVGRTGSFLYSRQVDVLPDITTLAKGVGSGYSTGAVLTSEAVARKVSHGDLGSTFGGSPLSCAAIQATLDVIESENLVENAASVGDYLKEKLLRFERVEEVRGRGLLLGLKFRSEPAKEVQQALLDRRVLTGGSSDPQVLRLMPALILGRNEADLFLETLEAIWE
jgi:acetylornithine/succinyldiaminopimelate/putrescine aminotransferase